MTLMLDPDDGVDLAEVQVYDDYHKQCSNGEAMVRFFGHILPRCLHLPLGQLAC